MEGDGETVFRHACKLGLEGIVSKRLGSRYRSGRSPDWLKLKNPAAPAVWREAEEDWGRGGDDHFHHAPGRRRFRRHRSRYRTQEIQDAQGGERLVHGALSRLTHQGDRAPSQAPDRRRDHHAPAVKREAEEDWDGGRK